MKRKGRVPTSRKGKIKLEHAVRLRDAFGMTKNQWQKTYPEYSYEKYRELIVGVSKEFLRDELGYVDNSYKEPAVKYVKKFPEAEYDIGEIVVIESEGNLINVPVLDMMKHSITGRINYVFDIEGKLRYKVFNKVYSHKFFKIIKNKIMVNLENLNPSKAIAILRKEAMPKNVLSEVAVYLKKKLGSKFNERKYGKFILESEEEDNTPAVEEVSTKKKGKKKKKKDKLKELPSVERVEKKKKKGKKKKKHQDIEDTTEAPAVDIKEKIKKGKKIKEEVEPEVETKVAETIDTVEEYPAEYLGKHVRFKPSARVTKEYKEVRGIVIGRHQAKGAKYYRVWVMELERISMLRITNPSITFYKKPNAKIDEAFKATGLKVSQPRRTKQEMKVLSETVGEVKQESFLPEEVNTNGKKKKKKKKKKVKV